MEELNSKSKRIKNRIIAGMLIFFVFNYFLVVPNFHWYNLLIPSKIVSAAISLVGLIILYNGSAELLEEHNNKKTKRFKIISAIGILLYAVTLISWYLLLFSNSDMVGAVLYTFNYSRSAIEKYVWLHRIRDLLVVIYLAFNVIINICLLEALYSATEIKGKIRMKVNLIMIISILSNVLSVCIISRIISDDLFFGGIIFIPYLVWVKYCISYIWKYISVSGLRKNGSIFNRIPEEEYQEFLDKMK